MESYQNTLKTLKLSSRRLYVLQIQNLNKLKEILEKDSRIMFAYTFGSAKNGKIEDRSDFDIAIYLTCNSSFEIIMDILRLIEKVILRVNIDLIILNGCENAILKYEVIMGSLLFTKDDAFLAKHYSQTLREYEDELIRLERCKKYRRMAL